jgi:beta-glucosidase
MGEKIKQIISQMTLEEKASLCSGEDFWRLKSVERLGVPSIMVTDGPHGLRKQAAESDHLGINKSVPATCFPTASATASSWNTELMHEIGEALAEECLEEDVAVILGPGANIKRSPLCGRNFEYISEDPYLTGEMAAALINGVQSKNVGTSLKHFAVNNQEKLRMTIDSVVDERALREIYLAGFEKAVKQAQPWTVMCAYNKVQGTYCSENKKLLTDILKKEWGHEGLVVTDWGACNDRVKGLKAGQELEMPSSNGYNDAKIAEAVKNGDLDEKILDASVERLLKLIFKSNESRQPGYKYDKQAHHKLARKAAGQSAVLLKNEDNILPLAKNVKVAVIGEFAQNARYQGSGSSIINPWKLDSAVDEFSARKAEFTYSKGYDLNNDKADEKLIEEAVEAAKQADVAVIYAGLPASYESEGFDREHLDMPESHNRLIEEVAKANPNTVVILQNGAPVTMPWIKSVKAVLESYLGGQAGSCASVDILYGDVNPSGKLAETFPLSIEDTPCYRWFPEGPETVEYRENIYVGYRYYDTAKKDVLFPFGYGLSYTSFEYSDIKLSTESIKQSDELTVALKVKNTGNTAGSEIVQIYVRDDESTVFRPEQELKGFSKIYLEPGEQKEVKFTLDKRSFAYYNTKINDWDVESGDFTIMAGTSSRDIRLKAKVRITGTQVDMPYTKDTLKAYYGIERGLDIDDKSYEKLLGYPLPPKTYGPGKKLSINSTLSEFKVTELGASAYEDFKKNFMSSFDTEDKNNAMSKMAEAMVNEMPLRAVILFAAGGLTYEKVEAAIEGYNEKMEV